MNERIKELAEQAGFSYVSDNGVYIPEDTFITADLKRFAELLLRDAFTIIEPLMTDPKSKKKVEQIITDRLGDAAYEVFAELGMDADIWFPGIISNNILELKNENHDD